MKKRRAHCMAGVDVHVGLFIEVRMCTSVFSFLMKRKKKNNCQFL